MDIGTKALEKAGSVVSGGGGGGGVRGDVVENGDSVGVLWKQYLSKLDELKRLINKQRCG